MRIILSIIEAFKYNSKPLKERLCIAHKVYKDGSREYTVAYSKMSLAGYIKNGYIDVDYKPWGDVVFTKTNDPYYVSWVSDKSTCEKYISDYLKTQKSYEEYKEPEVTFEDFKNE